ncbi:Alpha/Beta hydrolase protein [Kalaharituber pfeilii]|nr:Alpha/Beta hydrolase protein [Kalaharituber pfeilii]
MPLPRESTKIQPIHPTKDVRVTHEFATLNGRKYHYVNGNPTTEQKGVALLLHGFPDIWHGWRFIIPGLLDQGLRVIVPDLVGYGQTDKPICTPEELAPYTFKSMSNDLTELLRQLEIPKVVVIGHDWGAVLAQQFAAFHPALVTHIALVSVPFTPFATQYVPLEQYVKIFPNFRYQISMADPEKVEKRITTRADTERILAFLYKPKSPKEYMGESSPLNIWGDNLLEHIGNPTRSDVVTEEEFNYLVDQFHQGGFHGPCNWYRLRWFTYNDEKDLPSKQLHIPGLFIESTGDPVCYPDYVAAIDQKSVISNLTHKKVDAGHWVLFEDPDAVTDIFKEWFNEVVFAAEAKL